MPQSQLLQRIFNAIDPQSTVPLKAQLKGFFAYGISSGALQPGASLPSVRALAKALSLSPVTVSQLYSDLAEEGLVAARVGSGTFVAELESQRHHDTGGFATRVQDLVAFGAGIGLSMEEMREAIMAALSITPQEGLVLVVGRFEDAATQYAAEIQRILPPRYRAAPLMLEAVSQTLRADLIIAPHNFLPLTQARAPQCRHIGMTMLPSETTRIALARLTPHTRVLAVSYFPEFLPSFREALRHYGPHLGRIDSIALSDPQLVSTLHAHQGAVIYSTGSEEVQTHLPRAFEYRHSPDLDRLTTALETALPS